MKKILLSAVALAGLFAASVPAGAAHEVKGDANCDGAVNIFDVVRTQNIILGRSVPYPGCEIDLDMNCDEKVNVFDLVLIRTVALGNENPSTGCN